MTSEGAARVVTKDSVTPSPPRPVATDNQELAQPARDESPSRRPEPPRQNSLKRSASGRSRDSRAWEFWCDKDCRSELEEKAEKDGKGSAADAIGLMRAANSRKALQPLAHKQNAALARHQSWAMRQMKPDIRRPGLQRSQTSEGRLQTAHGHAKRKRFDKPGALDSSMSVHIPDNESDKENWSPGGAHERGDTYSAAKGRILGSKADAENVAVEDDAEVAAFMKGGRKAQRLPAGDEELDCVHGLLSLSQGNWAS
ncbi:hypothetical protein AMS68_000399 [Peltaster fructicola]|uniref:Uncharacterized protein n=1 Tax=Peltaster fructicola TaxID=286661 RepID=A0A6H0XJI9_9PEZI|nr:hypothetical protein AMS68_000399 [Peltaster fructicola]